MLLLVPLLVAMVVLDPPGMFHLIGLVFTVGGKLLSATAAFLDTLLGLHPH